MEKNFWWFGERYFVWTVASTFFSLFMWEFWHSFQLVTTYLYLQNNHMVSAFLLVLTTARWGGRHPSCFSDRSRGRRNWHLPSPNPILSPLYRQVFLWLGNFFFFSSRLCKVEPLALKGFELRILGVISIEFQLEKQVMATIATVTTNLQERTLWVSTSTRLESSLSAASSSEMSQGGWAEPEPLRPLPGVLCGADTLLSCGTSLVPQGGDSRWPSSPLTSHSSVNSYKPLEGLCFLLQLTVLTFSCEWRAGTPSSGLWQLPELPGPSLPSQLSNPGSRLRPDQASQREDGGWSPWGRAALKLTGAKSWTNRAGGGLEAVRFWALSW